MPQKIYIVLLFSLLFSYQSSFSQIKKEKDTTNMYKKLEKYSNKSKVGRYIHQLFFEKTGKKTSNPIKKPRPRFGNTKNKIIRKINIITRDPFGYSDVDSTRVPTHWTEKLGNRLHIKSTQANIRNFLLFKENQVFDSILVKESERLMRTQSYISTVVINISRPSKDHDSIDVNVKVLDSWSFVPTISGSASAINFSIDERNLIGTGHTLDYQRQSANGRPAAANQFIYIIPNYKSTFVKTTFLYRNDVLNNYVTNLSFDRPFYSPLTKWAGGYSIGREFRRDSLENLQFLKKQQAIDFMAQDAWIGRSFRVMDDGKPNTIATNIIVSGRIFHQKFLEKPELAFDPVNFYNDEVLLLNGIGISKRLFVEDKYIFKNGIIEDVPIGLIYGITNGYQFKNSQAQYYFGAQIAYGDYFKRGYLSANFEFGSFYQNNTSNRSSLSLEINYFTNLHQYGKWKIRQFIKPQFVIGNNRLNSLGDQLNINNTFGIQGFDGQVFGTKKMVLTLQTQAYSPWVVAGFRLNPYLTYSAAMLGDGPNGFSKSRLFSKIGIGLNINNDYLVFSAFQVSISYYPNIPGIGDNIFRTNGFENSDFGLQSFELAKPRLATYK
jgi:hypothetical protein